MSKTGNNSAETGFRQRLYIIIFEAETPAGKWFDIGLIISIMLSVLVVMLESIPSIREAYVYELHVLEWGFTLLFSLEYALRLYTVRAPLKYARSFFGIVDLVAVLPTYLSLFLPGSQYLLVIRLLRVLRVFRILKFAQHVLAARLIIDALYASRRKLMVFTLAVLTMVTVLGSLMYVIEGEVNGFTSIPKSIYWAIVTLTTVGYGDISPQSPLGQAFSALIMILGYSIIAVPTGIVTVEMAQSVKRKPTGVACPGCGRQGHDEDANFCKHCGQGMARE